MITSAQLRGARAMLELTVETLASESKLPVSAIEALETGTSPADMRALATVRSVLESHGVLFSPAAVTVWVALAFASSIGPKMMASGLRT